MYFTDPSVSLLFFHIYYPHELESGNTCNKESLYIMTYWVCMTHRKQVSENNSKKLKIILQHKKIFQKINHFDHCIKIYRIFNFIRTTFAKK